MTNPALNQTHTTEITAQNFDGIVAKPGIVLLDFWAAWCGPCRMFGPVFEAAAARHPDVVFGKVDTEVQRELAGAFAVRSIPTVMAFRDSVLVFEQPGMLPAKALEELLAALRALDMDDVRKRIAEEEATRAAAAGPTLA
jgi:thioredoxin 1